MKKPLALEGKPATDNSVYLHNIYN